MDSPDAVSPLLEFDPSRSAVIEPGAATMRSFAVPSSLVICYFRDAIRLLCAEGGAEEIGRLESEMGSVPVHALDWEGRRVGIVLGGVGAPLAVGWLEELIAMGVRRVVVVGGAGALVPGLTLGHVIVPTSAVRDEGTSHHYLPASRTVEPTPSAVNAITSALERRGVPYVSGATWTTDAFYRETRAKTERRVAEGCLTSRWRPPPCSPSPVSAASNSARCSMPATTSRANRGITEIGKGTHPAGNTCCALPATPWSRWAPRVRRPNNESAAAVSQDPFSQVSWRHGGVAARRPAEGPLGQSQAQGQVRGSGAAPEALSGRPGRRAAGVGTSGQVALGAPADREMLPGPAVAR